jgi:aspartate aminotransferase
MREYTVNIDGASKGFASTGVRVGWAFGAKSIIHKMRSVISHMGAWAPTPEQNGMGDFLKNTDAVDDFLVGHKYKLQRSLDALFKGVKQLASEGLPVDAISPMGAIYLTLKLDIQGKKTPEGELLDSSMKVTFHLIKEAGLALVPFTAFGGDSGSAWFRASVGASSFQEIEQVIPRLRKCLNQLI